MNILDKINTILNMQNIGLGYMKEKPDSVVGLFEYPSDKPLQNFGSTDFINNIQVRSRSLNPLEAYNKANEIAQILNRYSDFEIDIIQISSILDIGKDNQNPQRHEYTVNFKIYNKRSG